MRRVIRINILTLATLVLFLMRSPIFADTPAVGSQRYFCLTSAKGNTSHDAWLNIDPAKYTAVPGDIYVMVRLNNLLTTGDPNLDLDTKVLSSRSNYDTLKSSVGFGKHGATGLVGSANPVPNVANFPVNWHDDLDADKTLDHFWFGMQYVLPSTAGANGTAGGLQQGDFKWAVAVGSSDCHPIKWDPLGYVFDAQTLGVIPGAIITIYDASKTPPTKVPTGAGTGQVATNPFPTLNNGTYSFFTSPGSYQLTVGGNYNGGALKPLVIADPSTVNPNWKTNGYTNLYKSGNTIIEAEGQTVRADIAVNTVGAPAPVLAASTITDVNLFGEGESTLVSGTVTSYSPEAPNVKVVPVYVDPTNPLAEQNGTDNVAINVNGSFSFKTASNMQVGDKTYVLFRLNLVSINPTAYSPSKTNLFISWLKKIKDSLFVVQAAQVTSSVSINPIPSYLEGIARDSNGAVLPSVLVGVYLQGSRVPVYQARSDINGHYVIGSQYIPMLPYEIHITLATGDVLLLSTMDYLKQNVDFHKQNTINSFAKVQTNSVVDTTGVLMVTKTVVTPGSSIGTQSSNIGKKNTSGQTGTQNRTSAINTPSNGASSSSISGMQGVVMVIVVILVLVMIGVGAFIMMKSKQQSSSSQF